MSEKESWMPDFLIEPKAGWVKDAHKVKFATIYYSFHPNHGEDVRIIRSCGANIIIQTKDGKRIGVPRWMTDKTACLRITTSPIPRCSHNALRELQRLLTCIEDNL